MRVILFNSPSNFLFNISAKICYQDDMLPRRSAANYIGFVAFGAAFAAGFAVFAAVPPA
jgi:hypothetical protein